MVPEASYIFAMEVCSNALTLEYVEFVHGAGLQAVESRRAAPAALALALPFER